MTPADRLEEWSLAWFPVALVDLVDAIGSATPFIQRGAAAGRRHAHADLLPCEVIENPFGGEDNDRAQERRSSHLFAYVLFARTDGCHGPDLDQQNLSFLGRFRTDSSKLVQTRWQN